MLLRAKRFFIKRLLDHALIFIVIILSLIPRLWSLSENPPLIVDEAANLRGINEILEKKSLGVNEMHWDFHSTYLPYFPSILLIKAFPAYDHLLFLRLNSVFYSLLAIILLFFIIREKTNSMVAFLASLLFSYSYYFLQFSRVGWVEVIFVLSLGLNLIWIMQLAIKKNNLLLTSLGGLIAGLIFYGYRAGIIYILGAELLLIGNYSNKNFYLRTFLKHSAVYLFSFLVVASPWIYKILNNFERYTLRERVVSIKNADTPYHGKENETDIYTYQIVTSIKSWILLLPVEKSGDESPRYLPQDYSPYNILTKLLFWLGTLTFLFNYKKYKHAFFWFFVIMCTIYFSQIITVDPPNGSRALVMMPAYFVFASIALNEIFEKLRYIKFLPIIITFLCIVFSLLDFIYYKYWMIWIKV